jgi:hypothetical protein
VLEEYRYETQLIHLGWTMWHLKTITDVDQCAFFWLVLPYVR